MMQGAKSHAKGGGNDEGRASGMGESSEDVKSIYGNLSPFTDM